MLRIFALALVFVAGCGRDNNKASPDLSAPSGDLSAGLDGMAGGGDLGGGGDGGGIIPTDGGVAGASCQTACDCMPGLACLNNMCTAAPQPVYCCSGASCPTGKLCQSTGGGYAVCGGGGPGNMPDLAGFDYCSAIHCNGQNGAQQCMRFNCTQCVAAGNGMVCAK